MKKYLKQLMGSQNFGKTRLEAFSDGVFAIVITLLVLELRVPEVHSSQELLEGLWALLPKFVSFIVSFLYITIYWINHHQMFHQIKRTNHGLFWLNSLFLMCLTFIPFPTALIGSYPNDCVAVMVYGLSMLVSAIIFVWMKCYAFYGKDPLADSEEARPSPFLLITGPLLYLVAIAAACVNVKIALAIYILIPVIYFFAGGMDKK